MIFHLCKYFPPDVRLCMQGTLNSSASNNAATFFFFARCTRAARIRNNRRSLVKMPMNGVGENNYKKTIILHESVEVIMSHENTIM